MPDIQFTLNDTDVSVVYDDGMHFLEVLRECCGITTVKDGCAPQGVCGCCTILLDNRPALSCLLDPKRVNGRSVTTVEGLNEKRRQLLARAFVQEGAVQCGFCTPGIVTRAASLLDRHQAENPGKVKNALKGHICRCTGFKRIEDAIAVAGHASENGGEFESTGPRRHRFFGEKYGLARNPENIPTANGVGAEMKKHLGTAHVLGEKAYVADMKVEGMLHGAVVLAEHPRARILRITTSLAASMPGVRRIITADEVPAQRFVGLFVNDWPLLVDIGEVTRYVGDVIAIVVADSQYRARKAALEVKVDYEIFEPVTDSVMALKTGSPQVHESGNLLKTCAFSRGNVDEALAEATYIVDEVFETQRIEHAFLEPEACLVVPKDEKITVYSQSQGVHDDQRQIADILGIDKERIKVELVTNGGAFGGKEDLSIQGHAALACFLLNAPVRIALSREQSMLMHPKRHPLTLHYTVGADDDACLTAVRARIIGDTGAYASVGAKVLERAAGHSCGPYSVPNIDVLAEAVYTNNPPCGAMRGFGANQSAFAIEGVLDRLAAKAGIDGYDIRERNILGPGDRFATGQLMNEGCGIRQTLEAIKEIYRSAETAGIACGIKNTGIGNGFDDIGRVLVRIHDNERLAISTGYTEMGQGLHTILKQVISEETGLDPDLMSVSTVSNPEVFCGMTTASRATALCTAAARFAGEKLAAALAKNTLKELSGQSFHGEFICDFTTAPGDDVPEPITHMAFGYATQVVFLDQNGRLEKVIAAHDVGRAINPLNCAGQIEGGVHMGLGYALSEDFPCTGAFPDSTLMRDLGILKAQDTPKIEVILIETPDPVGGYGCKGIGEIGLVPTAAAVAGALSAYDGIWRNTLPMSASPAAHHLIPKSRVIPKSRMLPKSRRKN